MQAIAVEQQSKQRAPLGIVKRTEDEFANWMATERGFLQLFGRYSEDPIKFEGYQIAFLKTRAPYRCIEKSRQVGYSWVFACEALARAHLRDTYTGVFVSYNLSDAKEKIAYCQQMHEELPLEFQKKKAIDSKLEIGFQSNSSKGKVARIISNPSKAPRGKKGDVWLDELAHCANDRDIYKGSTALILRARSQLTICSSPLGRRGVFWELARQEVKQYPAFWRQAVPWWLCSFMCKDVVAASRSKEKHGVRGASDMTTPERVQAFGTKAIKDQFASLAVEDFQQEFEVFYSDETLTFFPYELILPCTEDDTELAEDFSDVAKTEPGRLVAGFDVGRKRDLSVFALFEEMASGRKRCRMLVTLEKAPFEAQEAFLKSALLQLPIARLSIDNTGLGMNLAENLARAYPNVTAEDFTTHSKEVWCNDFKILLQRHMVELPKERDLVAQIHSIKKTVTAGGRVTFDSDSTETKGHADKFWACALACQKERKPRPEGGRVGVRVFG